MKKPITKHFADLGAPLVNARYSWGAVRHGAKQDQVILRVWSDRKRNIDGRWFRQVVGMHSESPGYAERLDHVSRLLAGQPGFLVICTATDVTARPRKIASYSDAVLVPVGEVLTDDSGQVWAECLPGVPLASLGALR